MSARRGQQRRVFALAKDLGLDTVTRHELQERVTGERSLTKMNAGQLDLLAGALERRARALVPGSSYRPVLRALWISAHCLGVVRTPGWGALAAWMAREAGVDSALWIEPELQGRLVERLKAWLARPAGKGGGGVDWPAAESPRQAVLLAQRRLLGLEPEEPLAHRPADRGQAVRIDARIRFLGSLIRRFREPGKPMPELDGEGRAYVRQALESGRA